MPFDYPPPESPYFLGLVGDRRMIEVVFLIERYGLPLMGNM